MLWEHEIVGSNPTAPTIRPPQGRDLYLARRAEGERYAAVFDFDITHGGDDVA